MFYILKPLTKYIFYDVQSNITSIYKFIFSPTYSFLVSARFPSNIRETFGYNTLSVVKTFKIMCNLVLFSGLNVKKYVSCRNCEQFGQNYEEAPLNCVLRQSPVRTVIYG